ncbi:MAG: EAL domain-containing protein [Candidatus Nanopelagicales bacterium]
MQDATAQFLDGGMTAQELVMRKPTFTLRTQMTWMIVLTGIMLIGPFLPNYTFTSNLGEYDAIHTVLEFASIAISFMVAALAWNLRRQEDNLALLVLGLTSLAVAVIDIGHVLSYVGMPELITPSGAQKSITFWLTGRLIAALGLLVIALVQRRHVPMIAWIYGLLVVFMVVVAVCWIGLAQPDWLPRFYVEGPGLTTLKKVCEYGIAGVLAIAALLFLRRSRREGDPENGWLAAAAWTLALTELYFTFYANVTDLLSVIAHVYKVIAYAMIYRAIFVSGVQKPYNDAAHERSLLRSLINSIPDLIFVKDPAGKYLVANTAFEKYANIAESDLLGRTTAQITAEKGANRHAIFEQQVLASEQPLRTEEWIPAADGSAKLFDTLKTPFQGPTGEHLGLIAISRDISEQKAAEEKLDHLAHYDSLTGLPNQLLLAESSLREFNIARATHQEVAFVIFDIDDFHTINDAIGHEQGDVLLKQVAQRFRESIPPRDVLARPGGDEFVALLINDTPSATAVMVETLVALARRPFAVLGRDFNITVSAGIAMFPSDGDSYEVLRRFAEAALYRAKSDGRNTFRFFTDEMQKKTTIRLQTLNDLRGAARNDEFRLHYQPQISLADGSVCGAEALIRWEHPELGLIPPGSFIPLAEESGLILPMGDWVARKALEDAQSWRGRGINIGTMSINLSAAQFRQPDLAAKMTEIATTSGYPISDIEWEMTESATLFDPEGAVDIIQGLHDHGFHVSLDDFGTGYSSMAYLKRYRIDKIKIDQSFVRDLASDADDRSIVRAIIQMARSMNCAVLAEGVETAEQLEVLLAEGCDMAQGYYFSRPLPAEDFVKFLGTQKLGALSH